MIIPKHLQWGQMTDERKKRLEKFVASARESVRKEPAFASLEEAKKAAVKLSRKDALLFPSVWKEPKDVGSKFVVVRTENRENALNGGYTEEVDEQTVHAEAHKYDSIEEV